LSRLRLTTRDSKSRTEEEEKERLTTTPEEDLSSKIRTSTTQESTDS
jgi:hypothetical protein